MTQIYPAKVDDEMPLVFKGKVKDVMEGMVRVEFWEREIALVGYMLFPRVKANKHWKPGDEVIVTYDGPDALRLGKNRDNQAPPGDTGTVPSA